MVRENSGGWREAERREGREGKSVSKLRISMEEVRGTDLSLDIEQAPTAGV